MHYHVRLPRTAERRYQRASKLCTKDGKVVEATPALRWAIGNDIETVIAWVQGVDGAVLVMDSAGNYHELQRI